MSGRELAALGRAGTRSRLSARAPWYGPPPAFGGRPGRRSRDRLPRSAINSAEYCARNEGAYDRAMGERAVERRIVSVLFADLVGFTSLSERLDAEDVALVQDAYFAAARETVDRHGGVLEKFVGDAVMAVFGSPRTRDDDAERAVRAGLAALVASSPWWRLKRRSSC